MVSELFPVVASDQHAERKIRHPTPCPSPSMISKRQLASSTIVKYMHIVRLDLFKERPKIIHTTIS